jgi:hypothetical protein
MRPHNMLKAPGLDVIAADDLFDLPLWTGAVIDENRLTLAQLPHSRFLLEHLCGGRRRQSRRNDHDTGENRCADGHDVTRLFGFAVTTQVGLRHGQRGWP